MKKYINRLLIAFLAFAAFSCDSILEEVPLSNHTVESYYTNDQEVETALNGIYGVLRGKNLYYNSLRVDYQIGNDLLYHLKKASKKPAENYVITSTLGSYSGTWTAAYKVIYNCNLLIEKIENNQTIEDREKIIAEAKCLRSLTYFHLVRMWGDVPLILEVMDVNDLRYLPRTDKEEVYKAIIQGFEAGIGLLPTLSELPENLSGRFTKNAAMGFLTRVYMTMAGYPLNKGVEYYQKALDQATELIEIDGGYHTLTDNYSDVFENLRKDFYNPREVIFEIGNSSSKGSGVGGNIGTYEGIAGDKDFGGGYSYVKITNNLVEEYSDNDFRKAWNCVKIKMTEEGPVVQKNYTFGKYRRNITGGAYHYNQNPINWIALRYSDILLMYAEASNEIANANGAVRNPLADQYVAQIRERAFRTYNANGSFVQLDDDPIVIRKPVVGSFNLEIKTIEDLNYDYSGLNYEDFKGLIIGERARELCGEGLRKHDLIRWGLLYEGVKALGQKSNYSSNKKDKGFHWQNIKSIHVLLPIPQGEIDLCPNFVQNTGY